MTAEKANYEVTRMARLLGVSRSGFYAWAKRQAAEPGTQRRARDELDVKVRKVFAESDDVYGAPRVHAQLAREGTFVDRKTVAKSMLRQGLEGISPKKFTPVTTIPGVDTYKIPDRVKRGWDQGGLNRVWISDITYLRTGEGWLAVPGGSHRCAFPTDFGLGDGLTHGHLPGRQGAENGSHTAWGSSRGCGVPC
jgi:putative transposase